MSTRSHIAIINEDLTVKRIYVHFDGYGHLPTLKEHWNTKEEINSLMDLGDLSSLGTSIDTCRAYEETEDELDFTGWGKDNIIKHLKRFASKSGCEYIYIFDDQWTRYSI